MSKRLKVTTSR